MHLVNNKETNVGDKVKYVDYVGIGHKATITALVEQGGTHYAEVEFEKDGRPTRVTWVPYNVHPATHSWHHSQSGETP